MHRSIFLPKDKKSTSVKDCRSVQHVEEIGWGTIIYLAAMASINPSLYGLTSIDGAGRFRKMFNVTLPSIKPMIIILLIINVGNVLNAGFEIQYLLGNGLCAGCIELIDIFVLKYGINLGNYSLATMTGIFKSVVSLVLMLSPTGLPSLLVKSD